MNQYDKAWSSGAHDGMKTSISEHELHLLSGSRSVLDLGCGLGQNSVFLAQNGFSVTAIDYSAVAIEKTKLALEELRLSGRVLLGDIFEPLDFHDGEFDAIISYQVINHNHLEKIRLLLRELHRILKHGGLLSVKVGNSSAQRWERKDGLYYGKYNTYKKIAEKTFLPVEGDEKGIVHFLFDRETLLAELETAGFSLVDIREDEYHLLGNFRRR